MADDLDPAGDISCPLCGFRFRRALAPEGCGACPLGGNCRNRLCCPHCHYSWVDESPLVSGLANLLQRFMGKGKPAG